MDWLISNGKAVLGEYAEDDDGKNYRLGTHGKSLRKIFVEAGKLKNDRSVVIHGDWRSECLIGSKLDGCKPRCSLTLHAKQVFHVIRSRYRRDFEEQAWSIADIENLALAFTDLEEELRSIYEIATNEYLGRHDE
jgi:hypothetical protein